MISTRPPGCLGSYSVAHGLVRRNLLLEVFLRGLYVVPRASCGTLRNSHVNASVDGRDASSQSSIAHMCAQGIAGIGGGVGNVDVAFCGQYKAGTKSATHILYTPLGVPEYLAGGGK